MRLRNLRKLEEMEIRKEDKDLRSERKDLQDLLKSEKAQWDKIAENIKAVRTAFGPKTKLGKRRTTFAEAPEHGEAAIGGALAVREPITVVVSEKGWIRALRGHVADHRGSYSRPTISRSSLPGGDDIQDHGVCHQRALLTLDASKLPGGRGHGEPVRMFIDLRAGRRSGDRDALCRRAQVSGGRP